MNDDELIAGLTRSLALAPTDRERLTADFAQRLADIETERETLLWHVLGQALVRFHQQVATIYTHSHALTYPGQRLP